MRRRDRSMPKVARMWVGPLVSMEEPRGMLHSTVRTVVFSTRPKTCPSPRPLTAPWIPRRTGRFLAVTRRRQISMAGRTYPSAKPMGARARRTRNARPASARMDIAATALAREPARRATLRPRLESARPCPRGHHRTSVTVLALRAMLRARESAMARTVRAAIPRSPAAALLARERPINRRGLVTPVPVQSPRVRLVQPMKHARVRLAPAFLPS